MNGEPPTLARLLHDRMDALGITSVRGLAKQAGIGGETARRLFWPGRRPTETTLRRLADNVEGLSLADLRRALGRPGGHGPFVLPPEADQLDQHQRQVVLAMVRALLHTHTTSPVGGDHAERDVTLRPVPRLAARPRRPKGVPLNEGVDDRQ